MHGGNFPAPVAFDAILLKEMSIKERNNNRHVCTRRLKSAGLSFEHCRESANVWDGSNFMGHPVHRQIYTYK